KRHPAGDASIEKIASPVGFILVPIGRGTIACRLSEELVIPEFHVRTHQRGAKRPHPRAELGLCNVGPNPGRTALHQLELALFLCLPLFPRPIVSELVLLSQYRLTVLAN